MNRVIILGNGGHAICCYDTALSMGLEVIGFNDPYKKEGGLSDLGVKHIEEQDLPKEIELINGLGILPRAKNKRLELFNTFKEKSYRFKTLIHTKSIVARNVKLEEGVQIFAGCIIQPGVSIGENTILNTGSQVDHHSNIGAHCHISPGATICGNVNIGNNSIVGANASVIQNINIGSNCIIASGSTVYKSVIDNSMVKGARMIISEVEDV